VATREPRGRRSRDAIYRQLAEAADELRTRLSGLPAPVEAQDIWGDIWYQEAHHSTAIEGNTLVLREVEILLVEGRAVGEKQLAEYLEVRGYADAAEWVYQQGLSSGDWTTGDLVTLTEIRHIHALAMSTVWEVAPHPDASPSEGPGSFRQHNIRPFPGGMQPARLAGCSGPDVRLGADRIGASNGSGAVSGSTRPGPCRVRADPPIPRRQRPCRPAADQSAADPHGLRAGHPSEGRANTVSGRAPSL